jgi:hypothetical protein
LRATSWHTPTATPWSKSIPPWIAGRQRTRLSVWSAVDEDHEIMVLGIEEATMQAGGTEDLFCGLLQARWRESRRAIAALLEDAGRA